MSIQYKIDQLPSLLPNALDNMNEKGKDGWELLHLYNNLGVFKSSQGGTLSSGSVDPLYDAFGRQRVAIPFTLNDYKHIYSIDKNFVDFTSSAASLTFNVNRASVTLKTSLTSGSRAIHQTKMYHNYLPGKSQTILSSFIFGTAEPGVVKRTGYFDDFNGIFVHLPMELGQ
jgi:hypothetical protein